MSGPNTSNNDSTVIGVYDSLPSAESALDALRDAGFSVDLLTVICSECHVRERFPEYKPEAGPETWKDAALIGTSTGSVLAGLASAVALATGAALPIVVAGALSGLLTGGVVGGLAGLMIERGFEPDAVDYYVMAVSEGRCLVAVDIPQDEQAGNQAARAIDVLQEQGSEPVRIPTNPNLA